MSRVSLKEIHDLLRDLDQFEVTVNKKLSDLTIIDEEIEERKHRWHDFITKTEAKDKIVKELLSLIPLLREKYERMVKSHNFCSNSLNGFFLVNQMIQENEHYETNETPCLNREQIKLQLGDLGNSKDEYGPQVEKLESFDSQKLKNTDHAEIEALINEATALIKSLDNDNQNLDEITTYLREERRDFKDGDIYSNQRRLDRQIINSDEKLQGIIHEFESIRETIENTQITDAKLHHKIDEIESKITTGGQTLDRARQQFESVCRDIDREDVNTAKLSAIASFISKLGGVAKDLYDLSLIFDDMDDIFKDLQADLVDLYYSKKLAELLGVVQMLLERLGKLSNLIDKLIELAKEFEGYTSDNEEEEFVNDLESELREVKGHHQETEEELMLLKQQINELQDGANQNPPHIDEEKADKIDNAIGDLSKMIENIERLVDGKIQRFADMDPYKKFRRREKELNKLSAILSEREDILAELKRE